MNHTYKQEFTLNGDEINALQELQSKFPNASFGVKRKVRELSDTISSIELIVRVYGYNCETKVWRNWGVGWIDYPDECYDIW
jgi:hypothetical protein